MRRALMLVGAAAVPGAAFAWDGGTPYFTPAQFDLVATYADTLIPETDTPGALDAGVPRAIDAMMRDWASEATRKDFAAVLDALDAAARRAAGAGLAALSPERRKPVVAAFDAARVAAGDRPYVRLKELTLITYYLSEPGATQELRYDPVPGVWDAEMPLGDDRRAWAT
jgi:hypothetical protein